MKTCLCACGIQNCSFNIEDKAFAKESSAFQCVCRGKFSWIKKSCLAERNIRKCIHCIKETIVTNTFEKAKESKQIFLKSIVAKETSEIHHQPKLQKALFLSDDEDDSVDKRTDSESKTASTNVHSAIVIQQSKITIADVNKRPLLDNDDDDDDDEKTTKSEESRDDDTDSESKAMKPLKRKKRDPKSLNKNLLINNFAANQSYLTKFSLSIVDIFKICDTEDNGVVNISEVISCFKNADDKKKTANTNANEIELQVVEEYVFLHLDREIIKHKSFLGHLNDIINQLYNQCRDDIRVVRSWDIKVVRRWGRLIAQRIVEGVWKAHLKDDTTALLEAKLSKKAIKEFQETLSTRQSLAFSNILDLLRELLNDDKFFNQKRIDSILLALNVDNKCHYRQNKFKMVVENVEGTMESQMHCDAEYKKIVTKIAISEAKKKKVTPSGSDRDKVSDEVIKSDNMKQTIMQTYYAPQWDHKTNDDTLLAASTDELLVCLAELVKGGIDGFKSSLLQSDQKGSAIILNYEDFSDNSYLLRETITILRSGQTSKNISKTIKDLSTFFQSEHVKYSFLKFVDSVSSKEKYSIKPDGFCIYRLITLQFMAYCEHPWNYSLTTLQTDPEKLNRYDKLVAFIEEYGCKPFFNTTDTKFKAIFIVFWGRVVSYLEEGSNISDLNDLMFLPDDSTSDFSFYRMLTNIKGMLKFLEQNDEDSSINLPNNLWFEQDHLRLLAIVLSKIKWPSKFMVSPKPFLINVFAEVDFNNDSSIDSPTANAISSTNFAGLPNSIHNGLQLSAGKSCYMLNLSTFRFENDISDTKRLFNVAELAALTDPYTFLLFDQNHISMLKSDDAVSVEPICIDIIIDRTNSVDVFSLIEAISKSLIKLLIIKQPIDDLLNSPSKPLSRIEMNNRRSKQSTNTNNTTIPRNNNLIFDHSDSEVVSARHAEIFGLVKTMNPDDDAVDFTERFSKRDLYGANSIYDIKVQSLKRLAVQDDQSMIDSDSINSFGNLMNISSYGSVITCQLFVFDTYHLTAVLNASDDKFKNNDFNGISRQDYIELRLKLCKVLLFPYHADIHYRLFVLFPKEYMIIALDSLASGRNRLKIAQIMKRIVDFYNSIYSDKQETKEFADWFSYIDGDDPNIPLIFQQGTTLNCGVYVISYMKTIEDNMSIEKFPQMIAMFKNKSYQSLFENINPSSILLLRKRLTIALVDRIN